MGCFALLVQFWMAGCGGTSATSRRIDLPPSNTLWAGIRGGVALPMSATLASSSGVESLRVQSDPGPLFGAQIMLRTSRFDLGFQVDNLSGGMFQGLQKMRQMGSRSRIVAAARWRGLDASWGALYSGLGIGAMLFNHDDDLLSVAQTVAGQPQGAIRGDTDRFNSGFTFNLGAGVMFYVTRYLVVLAEAEMTGAATSISTTAGTADVDLALLGVKVNLGLELRIF